MKLLKNIIHSTQMLNFILQRSTQNENKIYSETTFFIKNNIIKGIMHWGLDFKDKFFGFLHFHYIFMTFSDIKIIPIKYK